MGKEKLDKGYPFSHKLKRHYKKARNKRIRKSKDSMEWKLYKGWVA